MSEGHRLSLWMLQLEKMDGMRVGRSWGMAGPWQRYAGRYSGCGCRWWNQCRPRRGNGLSANGNSSPRVGWRRACDGGGEGAGVDGTEDGR